MAAVRRVLGMGAPMGAPGGLLGAGSAVCLPAAPCAWLRPIRLPLSACQCVIRNFPKEAAKKNSGEFQRRWPPTHPVALRVTEMIWKV